MKGWRHGELRMGGGEKIRNFEKKSLGTVNGCEDLVAISKLMCFGWVVLVCIGFSRGSNVLRALVP